MQIILMAESAAIVVKLNLERFIYLLHGGRGFAAASGGEFRARMCVCPPHRKKARQVANVSIFSYHYLTTDTMTKEEELKKLVVVFIERFGSSPVAKSIFNTWLCGHCHTFPKRASDIIDDMSFINLIRLEKGMVEFSNEF